MPSAPPEELGEWPPAAFREDEASWARFDYATIVQGGIGVVHPAERDAVRGWLDRHGYQLYTLDGPAETRGFRTVLAAPVHAPYDRFNRSSFSAGRARDRVPRHTPGFSGSEPWRRASTAR